MLQGDGLSQYGWLKHNGNDFGVQEIHDQGVVIRTEYVKRLGGRHGGDWTARITATQPVSIITRIPLTYCLLHAMLWFTTGITIMLSYANMQFLYSLLYMIPTVRGMRSISFILHSL